MEDEEAAPFQPSLPEQRWNWVPRAASLACVLTIITGGTFAVLSFRHRAQEPSG
jgi:hypothetical protein